MTFFRFYQLLFVVLSRFVSPLFVLNFANCFGSVCLVSLPCKKTRLLRSEWHHFYAENSIV